MLTIKEVKEILGLELLTTTYDSRIKALLPGAISDGFMATNNFFHVPGMVIESYNISFSGYTLTDGTGNFTGYYTHENGITPISFQAGMYIHVEGSVMNDGVYEIDSISNNIITAKSTFFTEAAGALVNIHVMKIENAFKQAVAFLIGHYLESKFGVSSERFDNYSVTFKDSRAARAELFAGMKKVKG